MNPYDAYMYIHIYLWNSILTPFTANVTREKINFIHFILFSRKIPIVFLMFLMFFIIFFLSFFQWQLFLSLKILKYFYLYVIDYLKLWYQMTLCLVTPRRIKVIVRVYEMFVIASFLKTLKEKLLLMCLVHLEAPSFYLYRKASTLVDQNEVKRSRSFENLCINEFSYFFSLWRYWKNNNGCSRTS